MQSRGPDNTLRIRRMLWTLLRKHAYSSILKNSPPKTESFQIKILIFFHVSAHVVGSNEYTQLMFLSTNKKNNVYPCKSQFYFIKVGFKLARPMFAMMWNSANITDSQHYEIYLVDTTQWKHYEQQSQCNSAYMIGILFIPMRIGQLTQWQQSVEKHYITKICLYNFDPRKPHFYKVKLGFTGVYIIFLISAQKHRFGYSLEPPRRGGSNKYPQSMSSNMKNINVFIWIFSIFWRWNFLYIWIGVFS